MNFGHLAVFHAVAQTLSISRAGESLMISQPAVSKQLAQLERTLETVLVDRLPRGVRLTASGEALAEYSRRIFALADEAGRSLAELAGLSRGRLVVSATPTIGVYWLPAILVKYRRAHPGIEMRMEIHPTSTIARLLIEGSIDVGLAESPAEDERIDSRVLMKDRMVAITAPNGPLSRKGRVSVEELCRQPFIVREVGSGSKSLVERALAERGLKVTPAISLGSTEAIKRAVMEGVGVAIVSGLATKMELAAKKLIKLNIQNLRIERDIFIILTRGKHQSPAVRALLELVP